jgi:hypothetical protein
MKILPQIILLYIYFIIWSFRSFYKDDSPKTDIKTLSQKVVKLNLLTHLLNDPNGKIEKMYYNEAS